MCIRGEAPLDTGGEVEFIMGLAGNEGIMESILQWEHDGLSLIKRDQGARQEDAQGGCG